MAAEEETRGDRWEMRLAAADHVELRRWLSGVRRQSEGGLSRGCERGVRGKERGLLCSDLSTPTAEP